MPILLEGQTAADAVAQCRWLTDLDGVVSPSEQHQLKRDDCRYDDAVLEGEFAWTLTATDVFAG